MKGAVIGFVVGVAVGAPAGYFFCKKRAQKHYAEEFNDAVNAEVESYKASYKRAADEYAARKEAEKEAKKSLEVQDTATFQPAVRLDLNVPKVPDVTAQQAPHKQLNIIPEPDDMTVPPYPITDNEFGHLDEFDTRDWCLWADGIVTTNDSDPTPVSKELLDKALGKDFEKFFGWDEQYEDELFIRCNQLKLDIDLTRSLNGFRQWRKDMGFTRPRQYLDEDEDEVD